MVMDSVAVERKITSMSGIAPRRCPFGTTMAGSLRAPSHQEQHEQYPADFALLAAVAQHPVQSRRYTFLCGHDSLANHYGCAVNGCRRPAVPVAILRSPPWPHARPAL